MQAAARSGGIYDKPRSQSNRSSALFSDELDSVACEVHALDSVLIQILRAAGLSFASQKRIEVGSIPVRVGHGLVRTGSDEQLVAPVRIAYPRLAGLMMVEREPTF